MHNPTNAEVLAAIQAMRAEHQRTMRELVGIVTRKSSRIEQAKKVGCSVRTLQRRERRARARLMAGGQL